MKIEICRDSTIPELATLFVEMESCYFRNEAASYDKMLSYLTNRVFSSCSGVTFLSAWKDGTLVAD